MNKGIYPPAWAAMTKERAGEKYRPSNGTEGDLFFSAYCHRCMARALCPLPALTMAFSPEEDEYPEEWQYGTDGQPTCTAFENKDEEEVTVERCRHTSDMFEQGGAA